MATTKFYLRPSSTPGYSKIYVRFSWKRGTAPLQKATGLDLPSDAFDETRQVVRDMAKVSRYRAKYNARLASILDFFANYVKDNDEIEKKQLNKAWAAFYKSDPDQPLETQGSLTFNKFVKDYIDNKAPRMLDKRTKRPLRLQTIKNYKVSLHNLDAFNPALDFEDINLAFHDQYLEFLRKKKLGANSIGGYIKNIKVFARWAKREGYEMDPVIFTDEFFKPSEESISIYLDEDEIKKIFLHDFGEDETMQMTRAWFIIGCWTGLRVSDWNRLGKLDGDFITIKPMKTLRTSGKEVIIPLHPQVKQLVAAQGWPREVSPQHFNREVKTMAREAGITDLVQGAVRNQDTGRKEPGLYPKWQLVSSHTCRRSFATNLYKSNFPTISIMAITGHTTEKSFLRYIKVTPTEHAEKLAQHWADAMK